MNSQLQRAAIAGLMAIVVAGCTFAAPLGSPGPSGVGPVSSGPTVATPRPVATRTPRPRATPTTAPNETQQPTPRPTRAPTPEPTAIAGLDSLLGSDGRFTMLVMGVDSRTDKITGRTDTIMFVTIDPNTGKVAMASLPRDMVAVPVGPGKTFGRGYTRINALFGALSAQYGRPKAYAKMVQAMEYMSGIEIDRYAMIGFKGVRNLIDLIGGVDVKLAAPLVDGYMHVRMKGTEGLKLKAGKNHLNGSIALAFARTRHTDSDYARARRQQQLIVAATQKVLKKGASVLPALASSFQGRIKTDIKVTDIPALYALAQRAKLGSFKSTVLGPSKFGGQAPNDVLYATVLKMDAVRKLFQAQFGPVK